LAGIYQLSAARRVQSVVQQNVIPGLTGETVVIDPGHGGVDPGATFGNIREADLNMQLANALKVQLESAGVKTVLTRTGDQGLVSKELMTFADRGFILQQRKEYAADQSGRLFISIHVNSNKDPKVSGGIVYYADQNSRSLAVPIQQRINLYSGKNRLPVKKDFTITKGNKMPSVLVEAAFITNKQDREILTSKPEILAQAIFQGIQDYAINIMAAGEQHD
jgi:N-acetylmuramoyl-L-alanine amidase